MNVVEILGIKMEKYVLLKLFRNGGWRDKGDQ
jgi:hypothetical protein